MGADKARVELEGMTLLERAIRTLEPLAPTIVLACGRAPRYAEFGRALALDRVEDGGPLAGIEAGLAASPAGYACVLAVDLPFLASVDFDVLLARVAADELDLCLARSDRGPEPLCGVYHTRLLPRIRRLLDLGERKVTSVLEHPLDGLALPRFAWLEHGLAARAAANVNTPEDLERARRAGSETPRKAAS